MLTCNGHYSTHSTQKDQEVGNAATVLLVVELLPPDFVARDIKFANSRASRLPRRSSVS